MREDCIFRGSDGWCELMFHEPTELERMCPICVDYEPSVETVMSWLEGLTQDDWREFHSDSKVQNIAKYALALLKEQEANKQISDAIHETAKQFRQTIVLCKDCKDVECEGVEGFLVCDLSGFSHSPEFFCADGELKQQK